MVNIFSVFLPQLLLYPNPADPLNPSAAALMFKEPEAYKSRIREHVRKHAMQDFKLDEDDEEADEAVATTAAASGASSADDCDAADAFGDCGGEEEAAMSSEDEAAAMSDMDEETAEVQA